MMFKHFTMFEYKIAAKISLENIFHCISYFADVSSTVALDYCGKSESNVPDCCSDPKEMMQLVNSQI